MYKTTQQQKAIAERERRVRKPRPHKQTKKEVFTKTIRKQRWTSQIFLKVFFLQRPPDTKFHKPPTGFTKTKKRRGTVNHLVGSTPSPSPAPHTRDRAQRRQRTGTVARYILHIVNTHREESP